MNIEFKYERTSENTAKQLSGELCGLRSLNQSTIIPTLEGNVLTLYVKSLARSFFINQNPTNSRSRREDITSRDSVFNTLLTMFKQTDVWVKLGDGADEVKVIIRPDAIVTRTGEEEVLIIKIGIERQRESEINVDG